MGPGREWLSRRFSGRPRSLVDTRDGGDVDPGRKMRSRELFSPLVTFTESPAELLTHVLYGKPL